VLRISVQHEELSTSFTVEGRLTWPGVKELAKCWEEAEGGKAIVVRLAAVTFIDQKGKELLAQMCRQGARLVPTGCLMKAIVEEVEAEIREGRSHDGKSNRDPASESD
jgi:anti-anti-sigma regulatory factor